MTAKLGYLLPTREQIMQGRPETGPLLALAERAAGLGYDSVWVGDSLTARPRHDPLTLLAAVAGRVPGLTLGTAVLLPALRNPVLLAHQVATLDQLSDGNLILGVGFAADRPNIRTEFAAAGVPFEHRIGRMIEGLRLCRALWSGQPVDWNGRWQLAGAVVAPTPARPGGPPLWIGGNLPASLERAGKHFDGWFPIAPSASGFAAGLQQVHMVASAHGRDPAAISGAMYL
ncbi:MAG: LLM class flavin-dependent oxidoreductase, partial [Rhodopila sp.]